MLLVQKVILIHNTCDNHENEEKLKETQVVVGTPSTIWKSVGKINFDHVKMLMLDEVNFIEGADLQKVQWFKKVFYQLCAFLSGICKIIRPSIFRSFE